MRDLTRTLPVKLRLLLVASLLVITLPALAQNPTSYDLSWHVVAGGGGQISSAAHTVAGTAGQAAAGIMSGEGHTLASGFWAGGPEGGRGFRIYLPITMRSN